MNELMTLGELGSEAADDELLARYQQRDDEAALAAIHLRHSHNLWDYARRLLGAGKTHDADDIVQRAFLNFHAHRKEYPPKTCVRALLFKIVKDCCTDHIRHIEAQKRDKRRTGQLHRHSFKNNGKGERTQGCPIPDPKADPSKEELRRHVDEMLDTLTPKQAEAIRLVRIEQHTAESAAELLGLPPTTVRKRIKDGIDALRKRASANG